MRPHRCCPLATLIIFAVTLEGHCQQPQTPPVEKPPVIAPSVVQPSDDIPVVDPLRTPLAINVAIRGSVQGDLVVNAPVGQLLELTLTGDGAAEAGPVFWTYSEAIPDRSERDEGHWVGLTFPPDVAGKAYLLQAAINGPEKGPPLVALRWIVVSGLGPQPPPVVDPVDPDAKPPKPPVNPSAVGPFRALIVYDTDSLGSMQKPQRDALQSSAVGAYLSAKCIKEIDGTPSWRSWDDSFTDDQITDGDWLPLYRKTLSEQQGGKPWLCVWNPKGELIGSKPVPATEDELLALLRSFGGQ